MRTDVIQSFVGLGVGAERLMLEQNGTIVSVGGTEQSATVFGLEGILGVNLEAPSRTLVLNVRAMYSHAFAADNSATGIPSQDWNNIGIGGRIAYFFGM